MTTCRHDLLDNRKHSRLMKSVWDLVDCSMDGLFEICSGTQLWDLANACGNQPCHSCRLGYNVQYSSSVHRHYFWLACSVGQNLHIQCHANRTVVALLWYTVLTWYSYISQAIAWPGPSDEQ